jgi:hypothetical protein
MMLVMGNDSKIEKPSSFQYRAIDPPENATDRYSKKPECAKSSDSIFHTGMNPISEKKPNKEKAHSLKRVVRLSAKTTAHHELWAMSSLGSYFVLLKIFISFSSIAVLYARHRRFGAELLEYFS